MEQHIHCIVNDCQYWNQGNMCAANEILVSTDDFANQKPDRVDAKMATQLTPAAAGSCAATACKTYANKGSNKMKADGNMRMS